MLLIKLIATMFAVLGDNNPCKVEQLAHCKMEQSINNLKNERNTL